MNRMELGIHSLTSPSPADWPLEIVERKGLGHPDSICDALVENVSRGLVRTYHEQFGVVLHHNVDKALLVGGAARPAFGTGEVLEPIEIVLAGRATREHRGKTIPVDALAIEWSRQWLREHLRHLDVDRHVRIVSKIRPTSTDLAVLFSRRPAEQVPLANDTSIGTGYAPIDALERAVLETERALNAPEALRANPADGEDVKVMGVRGGERIALTVARAFVGRHVDGMRAYRDHKARVADLARGSAQRASGLRCTAEVNSADGDDPQSIYLTVTGLSAEAGDDGQVGRGNRVNGLITPSRPMSLEAAAGKNPVTHVGKLYNVVARRLTAALVDSVAGIVAAECLLVSQIGRPITQPGFVDLRLRLVDPGALAVLRPQAESLLRAHLEQLPQWWREALVPSESLW